MTAMIELAPWGGHPHNEFMEVEIAARHLENYVSLRTAKTMRASFLVLGPLLARFGS